MYDSRSIAVIDSGVGGLHILQSLVKQFPNESFLFIADEAYFPYGIKTKPELIERLTKIVNTLETLDVKGIIIACNTASSVAEELKQVTEIPIIEIISITSQYALKVSNNQKIGLWATNATIKSNCYQTHISNYAKCYAVSASDLVVYIENDDLASSECLNSVNRYLKEIEDSDTLILGCTHFPLLSEIISQIKPSLNLVSSNIPVQKQLDVLFDQHIIEKSHLNTRTIMLCSTLSTLSLIEKSKRFELPNFIPKYLEIK